MYKYKPRKNKENIQAIGQIKQSKRITFYEHPEKIGKNKIVEKRNKKDAGCQIYVSEYL